MDQIPCRSINGKPVGNVGYGMLGDHDGPTSSFSTDLAAGLSIPWSPVEYPIAVKLLKLALDHGANVWNGSTHYGTPDANSVHLVKYYFEQYPEDVDKVFLTMKGAYDPRTGPDGTPEGIRASVEAAYSILKDVKIIDAFAMGRVDPNVPIETSIAALAELVAEGKIASIGLSEVSADTIRRACAVHPIATAEIELSLFTPDPIGNGILKACRENAVQVIAYSPIGRGWLTNDFHKLGALPEDDFRRRLPRFQPEVFGQNSKLVAAVEQMAIRKGVSTAQVALSWVVAQGAIPIPGSKTPKRIEENCAVIALSEAELLELNGLVDSMPIAGLRYGGQHEQLLNA
ncbi:hypothetical protein AMS68_005761 [Peltaster fructicola]|uniref:NADP-dependent oxidoreductase domain-containing protein n=1 Tax=Peltaster fructicola TaxID=286661 RepID=A0A6H0XZS8_9PEZI|nr:hypothetical protein AMS68_005761 [Peltaster fructicola]